MDSNAVLSNVIAAIIFAVLAFLFTNSKWGRKIIAGVKSKIDNTLEERKRANILQEEIEVKGEKVKKASSKLYAESEQYDVNTFFTINPSDLKSFDIVRFIIKDKVDRKNVFFDVKTKFLISHTPPEYFEGENKKFKCTSAG